MWVSNPSWPNHKSVFNAAGLEVREYAYYDAENHTLDFEALQASLSEAQAGDVVLFHGCCHNPTGIDPTLEQWQVLAELSVEKGGCRYSISLTRALPAAWKKMRKVCAPLPRCIKSLLSPAPTPKTSAYIMSASAPAPSWLPMRKPWIALLAR